MRLRNANSHLYLFGYGRLRSISEGTDEVDALGCSVCRVNDINTDMDPSWLKFERASETQTNNTGRPTVGNNVLADFRITNVTDAKRKLSVEKIYQFMTI